MKKQGNWHEKGFTLVEMLIVVLIILILMGLLTSKILAILHVTKEVKTMAECLAVSQAFNMYVQTHGGTMDADNPVNVSSYGPQHPSTDLAGFLSPKFIKWVPPLDAWGRPYEYYYTPAGSTPDINGPHVFLIRSLGEDGAPYSNTYTVGPFNINLKSTDIGFQGDDIVCADGESIRWPSNY